MPKQKNSTFDEEKYLSEVENELKQHLEKKDHKDLSKLIKDLTALFSMKIEDFDAEPDSTSYYVNDPKLPPIE
jgi:hypothetical protein